MLSIHLEMGYVLGSTQALAWARGMGIMNNVPLNMVLVCMNLNCKASPIVVGGGSRQHKREA